MIVKNIVLIHGWGAGIEKLNPLGKYLEKLGWNVLILELPGFDVKAPKEAWDLQDYSNFVLKQIEKKWGKKEFFLLGHSFGGRIGIKIASRRDKAIKLSGIILCATGGISRGSIVKRFVFLTFAKIGKIFLLFPPFARIFQKILYKLAREHDYEKTQGIMKDIFKKVISEDLRPLVSKIRVDTLIIWGKMDRLTPYKDALFLENNLHRSNLITFENSGHRLPYEKAKELAKEIDLWSMRIQ